MSNALEQSLDDIIGEQKKARRNERGPRNSGRLDRRTPSRGRSGGNRPPVRFGSGNSIPSQILKSADGRPMLRLKNVHPELNGEDLSNLFISIAPVDFIKFDPRDETIAYVCFQLNYADNNAKAVQKFDGRKAMGQVLVVENAVSLADRIAAPKSQGGRRLRSAGDDRDETPKAREAHRSRAREKKQRQPRRPRPAPKTAEDLDAELSAYMSHDQSNSAGDATNGNSSSAFPAQNNGETMMD